MNKNESAKGYKPNIGLSRYGIQALLNWVSKSILFFNTHAYQ